MRATSFLIGFSSVADISDGKHSTALFLRLIANELVKCRWFGIAILLSIVILTVPVVISGQPGGVCKCEDVPDLLDQLNKANAALAEIQNRQRTSKKTDMVNEVAPAPNPTGMTNSQSIVEAINRERDLAHDRNVRNDGSVALNSVSCEITVKADTDCLKSVLDVYGMERKSSCENRKRVNKLAASEDAMNFWPVDDYLLKMAEDYRRMIAEILKRLTTIDKKCSRLDWFGSIMVSEEIKNESNESRNGTVTTMNDNTIRTGTIILSGREETNGYRSFWNVSGGSKFSSVTNSASPCSGGLGTKGPDLAWNGGMTRSVDYSGGSPATVQVDIGDPENFRVQIGVGLGQVNAQGKGKVHEWRTNPCPDGKAIDRSFDMDIPDFVLNAGRVPPFLAPYFSGDPEKLSGSETINMFPYPVAGQSHTVRVSYNLYRVRRH